MNWTTGIEKCVTFINCQLQPPSRPATPGKKRTQIQAITISRQTGSGGHAVAVRLAEYLQARAPGERCAWTVFDRNLVEHVIEDHHLPKRLAQFMPEDKISEITDTMDELFGLHPASWTLVRQTSETILHLAQMGNAILIGRGATIITRNLDYVFHVRLVGSVEGRAQFLQKQNGMSRAAALKLIRKEDRGRERYVRKYFGDHLNNPLLFHMVINTDLVSHEQAARIIGDAVLGFEPVPVEPKSSDSN